MTKYEIYTEDKNLKKIESILSNYFLGFTIQKTIGQWRGIIEKGLLIIIFSNEFDKIKRVAKTIKLNNNQECVLIWDGKQEYYI